MSLAVEWETIPNLGVGEEHIYNEALFCVERPKTIGRAGRRSRKPTGISAAVWALVAERADFAACVAATASARSARKAYTMATRDHFRR